jgi:hypothetical protein
VGTSRPKRVTAQAPDTRPGDANPRSYASFLTGQSRTTSCTVPFAVTYTRVCM